MTMFFLIATVICAVGWIKNRISVLTISTFLEKKNIHPTDDELNECSKFVVEHLLKFK